MLKPIILIGLSFVGLYYIIYSIITIVKAKKKKKEDEAKNKRLDDAIDKEMADRGYTKEDYK